MIKYLLFMALVVFATPVFGADSDTTGNLPGNLIDDLMKKNGGEAAVSVKTAESALPTRKVIEKNSEASKNIEATQALFSNPAAATPAKTEKSLWGRMFVSLFIALTLFGGGVYAYRRWPGSKKIAQRAKMIEVLNQHHLGPKRSIAVVRVAGEAVLIGVTDHNISLLKNLSLLDDDVPVETREAHAALKKEETFKFEKTLGAREEEFSMQGLKAIIGDRLKNMKELR